LIVVPVGFAWRGTEGDPDSEKCHAGSRDRVAVKMMFLQLIRRHRIMPVNGVLTDKPGTGILFIAKRYELKIFPRHRGTSTP